MIVGVAGENMLSKYFTLLVCFLIALNSVQGTVLCFGADGHIEFESAFHKQCTIHDHSQPATHNYHSSEAEHDEDKHCHQGQCVDIPFDIDFVQISQKTEQLDRAFAAFDADAVIVVLPPGFFECNPVSADFLTTGSYFSPLSTIVMLA